MMIMMMIMVLSRKRTPENKTKQALYDSIGPYQTLLFVNEVDHGLRRGLSLFKFTINILLQSKHRKIQNDKSQIYAI